MIAESIHFTEVVVPEVPQHSAYNDSVSNTETVITDSPPDAIDEQLYPTFR